LATRPGRRRPGPLRPPPRRRTPLRQPGRVTRNRLPGRGGADICPVAPRRRRGPEPHPPAPHRQPRPHPPAPQLQQTVDVAVRGYLRSPTLLRTSFARQQPLHGRSPRTMPKRVLTTESGAPIADNQNSATAGVGGPILLQDQHLLEKLARFNRER